MHASHKRKNISPTVDDNVEDLSYNNVKDTCNEQDRIKRLKSHNNNNNNSTIQSTEISFDRIMVSASFNDLPLDTIIHLLGYLPYQTLVTCVSLVNRQLNHLVNHERRVWEKQDISITPEMVDSSIATNLLQQVQATSFFVYSCESLEYVLRRHNQWIKSLILQIDDTDTEHDFNFIQDLTFDNLKILFTDEAHNFVGESHMASLLIPRSKNLTCVSLRGNKYHENQLREAILHLEQLNSLRLGGLAVGEHFLLTLIEKNAKMKQLEVQFDETVSSETWVKMFKLPNAMKLRVLKAEFGRAAGPIILMNRLISNGQFNEPSESLQAISLRSLKYSWEAHFLPYLLASVSSTLQKLELNLPLHFGSSPVVNVVLPKLIVLSLRHACTSLTYSLITACSHGALRALSIFSSSREKETVVCPEQEFLFSELSSIQIFNCSLSLMKMLVQGMGSAKVKHLCYASSVDENASDNNFSCLKQHLAKFQSVQHFRGPSRLAQLLPNHVLPTVSEMELDISKFDSVGPDLFASLVQCTNARVISVRNIGEQRIIGDSDWLQKVMNSIPQLTNLKFYDLSSWPEKRTCGQFTQVYHLQQLQADLSHLSREDLISLFSNLPELTALSCTNEFSLDVFALITELLADKKDLNNVRLLVGPNEGIVSPSGYALDLRTVILQLNTSLPLEDMLFAVVCIGFNIQSYSFHKIEVSLYENAYEYLGTVSTCTSEEELLALYPSVLQRVTNISPDVREDCISFAQGSGVPQHLLQLLNALGRKTR